MRELNLKEEFEKNDFEEISEECGFQIEGGCGMSCGWVTGSGNSIEATLRGYDF